MAVLKLTPKLNVIRGMALRLQELKEERDEVERRIKEFEQSIAEEVQNDPDLELESLYWNRRVKIKELAPLVGMAVSTLNRYVRPLRKEIHCKDCGAVVPVVIETKTQWMETNFDLCPRCCDRHRDERHEEMMREMGYDEDYSCPHCGAPG